VLLNLVKDQWELRLMRISGALLAEVLEGLKRQISEVIEKRTQGVIIGDVFEKVV